MRLGDHDRIKTILAAIRLSLGSAIALGLARFSYALLLPPMKADLGWSFAQAGALNTANAIGYLLGALAVPLLSRKFSLSALFLAGGYLAVVLVAACGLVSSSPMLLTLRLATGVASALIFVSGGVLAARLATAAPTSGGLILGLYYGGTGYGIILSSILVPAVLQPIRHGWQPAWFALAAACAVCVLVARATARGTDAGRRLASGQASRGANRVRWHQFGLALGGYGLFGVGYIGYMTFIIALLRADHMSSGVISGFYIVLGIATVFSANIWSKFLDRTRGGQALAAFNALLGIATLMPALIAHPLAAFISGALFGATFLSAVASTTAFVRHNLPPEAWTNGISAFTIVFAAGQIAGPVVIGWISDSAGLTRGLVYSAVILLVGALLAACQRALHART
ncbi:MAG: YbfB/YjiJ family MFS transporter [Burkholderiales bacterium]|nr:YbfB/YjiJ family MFS transporter [Burkholderiales bacterium]MDE2287141.1 YbfB/YjiJ family MFS transporter [Burkholderiales bacterium]MDE2610121.1 YbfB/YjiJ family MFS transporter [Burkholderiales bacterium]